LFDDFNVARSRKYLIETEEDLDKLKYLLYPLPDEEIHGFREATAQVARAAEELGVLLEGQGSSGTDAVTWLCGVDGMVFMALDQPEMFDALLDVVHEWDKRNVEILLDTPVDLVNRRGWYEGTAFWSPDLFRRFFQPRIKELADMVHQADRLMGYILSTGFMPLLDVFVEIGYDAHFYIDPVMGGVGVDLSKVKSTFANKIAVIGGLNSPVTLESGSRDAIRQEVFKAVEILGAGGGLVLTPVDCISASTPWQNIEILIDAWKEVRDCPVQKR
jgi:uroporphyrinogen-III decarboxylase